MAKYGQNIKRYQVGDYWLSQQTRSKAWCRTWYDQQSHQTRRASLGTQDFAEAKQALDDWFVLEHQKKGQSSQEVTIAAIFARYYEKYGSKLKSHKNTSLCLRYWLDFHQDATLAEAADLSRQEAFRYWLRDEKGQGLNSVLKIITVGKSAFNWAYKRGEIEQVPYFELVKPPMPEPKGRHLEVSEVARLLSEANHPHLKLFILMMVGTAARPQAVLDLTYGQIDFEQNLIDLNPIGRTVTRNKIRPVVKLPLLLKPVLQHLQATSKSQAVIEFNGKPVKGVRSSWRKLRDRAGLDGKVQPYSFRRTMARYMRIKGVPAWEVAEQLGHKTTGYQITEIYTSHSPDYLEKAVAAIDSFFGEIACEMRVSSLLELFGEK